MHDILIVGAGPAGSLAARTMAEKGYEVMVLEEHRSPGKPQHCTGLVSEETIRMSRVKPDILSTLYGAEVVFPNGQSITVRADKPKAYLVDRIDLEIKMAEAAQNAGADYCYSEKYKSHSVGDAVLVETNVKSHRGKVLIGADGASSAIAMSLGENRPKEYLRGIQADVNFRMDDHDTFKMFIGNSIAPGFFAWMIPCESFTRFGLCASWSAGPPSEFLSDMLIRMGMQDRVMRIFSGKIPLGIRPMLVGDRIMLTGDAAGFVKPMSGGGLYPTFRANKPLTDTILSGLDADLLYSRDLSAYERLCNEDFGRELERSYALRKRYKKFTDADFNRVYDYLIKNDIVSDLNNIDIDHPTETLSKVLRKPKNFVSALSVMLRTIR